LYQVLVAFKEFKAYKVELVYKVLVDYREPLVLVLRVRQEPREQRALELKVYKDVKEQLEQVPKAQQVPRVFRAYKAVA
jgi:hypothetical protein